MRRSPSLLVALGAAAAELVLVAAAGNQWIVKHLVENARADELPRDHQLKAVLTSFPWRFSPVSHERAIWLGGIVAAAGLVVVVFLVVLAFAGAVRPPRSFFAVLFGTWGLVLGLTQLAAVGRLAIAFSDLFEHSRDPQGLGRVWYPIFHGPSADSVLFGGVTGLLVAIVAAILASATNQTATERDEEEDAFTPVPEGGLLGSGDDADTRVAPPPWQAESTTRSWSAPTTTAPRWPSGPETSSERFEGDSPAGSAGRIAGSGPDAPAGPAGSGPPGSGPAGSGPAGSGPAGSGSPGSGPSGLGGSTGTAAPGSSGPTGSAGWSKPARPAFGSAGAKASWPTTDDRSRFPRPSDPPFGS
jgi:hypothetical protein